MRFAYLFDSWCDKLSMRDNRYSARSSRTMSVFMPT